MLTGTVAQAESSILEGIETMPDGEASEDAILYAALKAGMASASDRPCLDTHNLPAVHLPVELRRVLRLPEARRRPFVLRVLVGLW
jgi:hypothetical protein